MTHSRPSLLHNVPQKRRCPMPPRPLARGQARLHSDMISLYDRHVVLRSIIVLLRAQKPHATTLLLAKVPPLAEKLERMLYASAASTAEYMNPATLFYRISQIHCRRRSKFH
ncbi:hypothetical protein H310_11455 [Aphanomyces invadans]|uniref:Uncharacterized protein n=1 Tax=Aphanomyces invadans TaxID=157072 RepID=A0A024TMD3_9STRA|nr:hypothetical protein H310_11455 [Aphanomyces invadans]ETV95193.1 hypothetical protein H310_11455 [Aphanomyces invadans]|eukprot:XP_008876366.1 hypothetical protein H310_11455 [Aphanomyces invadans]